MSEIAVKIYERYRIAAPIYGKNGADQSVTLFDCDSNLPVTSVPFTREGQYEIKNPERIFRTVRNYTRNNL